MLHELDAHVFRNEFERKPPNPDDCALFYEGRSALLLTGDEEQLQLPTFGRLLPTHPGVMDSARFLFTIDSQGFFLAEGVNPELIDGASMQPLEIFRSFVPQHMGFAGVTGSHLYRFYQQNAYCGCCAHPMRQSETERAMCCPGCGNIVYPKISPAVIVGVTDGDRLLMTKYAGRVYNRYALVAGFAEFGEPLERTVEREVLEEVGLHVRRIRYYNSQPWPFSDSILLGFFCDVDGDAHITLDDHELAEGTWFHRGEIPATENTISLTNTMIEAFRRGEHS